METTLTKETGGAIDLLTQEHQKIRDYFREFEETDSDRQKKSIGDKCLRDVEIVMALEEELFYPAVRRHVGERQRVVQALAANQVAKLLIKELKTLSGGEQYNARFGLLKDNLLQHFEAEQNEILPRVERSSMDLDQLSREMQHLKNRLQNRYQGFNVRNAAAIVAGVAAVGAAAWLATRASSKR